MESMRAEGPLAARGARDGSGSDRRALPIVSQASLAALSRLMPRFGLHSPRLDQSASLVCVAPARGAPPPPIL